MGWAWKKRMRFGYSPRVLDWVIEGRISGESHLKHIAPGDKNGAYKYEF